MKKCPQTNTQSVYEHGISVKEHMFQLINFLENKEVLDKHWRIPDWITEYKSNILGCLLNKDIIEEYTMYHDCSKPYCIQYDCSGNKHFPNHAEVSYQKWIEVGGHEEAALLMKMDMDIHYLKDKDVDEFCKRPQAITLLLAGLSEVHSNSLMFGGNESTSFKIKWKQINKRGKAICYKLFGENHGKID